MGLFLDAARAWNALRNTTYILDIARKRKLAEVKLSFSPEDFPHLSGMQYAKDIDFGGHKSEYQGEHLVPTLLNGEINDIEIERSRNWQKISGRLEAIIGIEKILDETFTIAAFSNSKVRCHSRIEAEYVIKGQIGDFYFVLLDSRSGRYYCKSAFRKERVDYVANQSVMTVLQKVKIVDGFSSLLYRRPGYEPN